MAKRNLKKSSAVKASPKTKNVKKTKAKAVKKAAVVKTSKPKAKITAGKKSAIQKTSKAKKVKTLSSKKITPPKVSAVYLKKASRGSSPKKKASTVTVIPKSPKKTASFVDQKLMEGEYMNLTQQKHFRAILLDWKKQLLGEMERTVHHMQDDAANFPDPNDRATQEEEFSLELRARDRERKLIKKIDEALARLDNQEYGYCEACGIEIGVHRLSARPTATLCIDCKTIDEIREKHFS